VVGRPVGGLALQRRRERVLHHLLGEVEVAEEADQRREDPTRFLAEDALDGLDASLLP